MNTIADHGPVTRCGAGSLNETSDRVLQIIVKGRRRAAERVAKWTQLVEILEEAENVELEFE